MIGKIARLSCSLRDQINRRLNDAEPHQPILAWLNALPEVQAVLAQHFDAKPITKQNLSDWTRHGFRNWKLRQDAFEFSLSLAQDTNAEDLEPEFPLGVEVLDQLSQWLILRYTAAANSLPQTPDDPDAEFRRLHNLTADVLALRRADLCAGRLHLDQKRLAMLEYESAQKLRKAEADRKEAKRWRRNLALMVPEIIPYLDPPEDPDPSSDPPLPAPLPPQPSSLPATLSGTLSAPLSQSLSETLSPTLSSALSETASQTSGQNNALRPPTTADLRTLLKTLSQTLEDTHSFITSRTWSHRPAPSRKRARKVHERAEHSPLVTDSARLSQPPSTEGSTEVENPADLDPQQHEAAFRAKGQSSSVKVSEPSKS